MLPPHSKYPDALQKTRDCYIAAQLAYSCDDAATTARKTATERGFTQVFVDRLVGEWTRIREAQKNGAPWVELAPTFDCNGLSAGSIGKC